MTTGAGTHSSALTADRSPLSDSALVAAARKGDMKAFERLYRLHSGKVMGLCLRMTRRRDVAEDCVQQTFIRAWRSLAAFEGRSAFGTWLHRIAVNEVLTHAAQSRHARGVGRRSRRRRARRAASSCNATTTPAK